MRPIVVYDTNVLISGMIWGGTPYDCIALAQENNRMCRYRRGYPHCYWGQEASPTPSELSRYSYRKSRGSACTIPMKIS